MTFSFKFYRQYLSNFTDNIGKYLTEMAIKFLNSKEAIIQEFLRKRVLGISADPDQTPHKVASDEGLHCSLTGFIVKHRTKATPLNDKWTRPTY